MIQLVIALNVAIALLGFLLAWRLWRLRCVLAATTVALESWERQTRVALSPDQSLADLRQSQAAMASVHQRYRRLQRQLKQLQTIFITVLRLFQLLRAGIRQDRR
ncbi:MAG: hypothetical protein ACFBSG_03140 [Leptolyngbyaceae cyanobacterium]